MVLDRERRPDCLVSIEVNKANLEGYSNAASGTIICCLSGSYPGCPQAGQSVVANGGSFRRLMELANGEAGDYVVHAQVVEDSMGRFSWFAYYVSDMATDQEFESLNLGIEEAKGLAAISSVYWNLVEELSTLSPEETEAIQNAVVAERSGVNIFDDKAIDDARRAAASRQTASIAGKKRAILPNIVKVLSSKEVLDLIRERVRES